MHSKAILLIFIISSLTSIALADGRKNKEADKTLTEKIERKIEDFEKNIEQVNSNTNVILTICGIVLTVTALFGIGGPVAVYLEAKNSHKKYKSMISDFNAARQDAITSLQEDLRNIRIEFDQHTRIIRLSKMLIAKDYNEEIFYADLRQLETRPNYLMVDLVNQILALSKNVFSKDIIEIAESIRTKLIGQ